MLVIKDTTFLLKTAKDKHISVYEIAHNTLYLHVKWLLCMYVKHSRLMVVICENVL